MTNANLEPLVFDVREVAAMLKLCPSTIRNMIAAGELKSIKLRDRRVVRKSDLHRFLEQATEAA